MWVPVSYSLLSNKENTTIKIFLLSDNIIVIDKILASSRSESYEEEKSSLSLKINQHLTLYQRTESSTRASLSADELSCLT